MCALVHSSGYRMYYNMCFSFPSLPEWWQVWVHHRQNCSVASGPFLLGLSPLFLPATVGPLGLRTRLALCSIHKDKWTAGKRVVEWSRQGQLKCIVYIHMTLCIIVQVFYCTYLCNVVQVCTTAAFPCCSPSVPTSRAHFYTYQGS